MFVLGTKQSTSIMYQSTISKFRDSSDESVAALSIGCSESEDEILIKNGESLHCMSAEEVEISTAPHGKFIRTTSTATTTTSAFTPKDASAAATPRGPRATEGDMVSQLRYLAESSPLIADLILNASEVAEEQCNEIERQLFLQLPPPISTKSVLRRPSVLTSSRLFAGLTKNKKNGNKTRKQRPGPTVPKSKRFFGR